MRLGHIVLPLILGACSSALPEQVPSRNEERPISMESVDLLEQYEIIAPQTSLDQVRDQILNHGVMTYHIREIERDPPLALDIHVGVSNGSLQVELVHIQNPGVHGITQYLDSNWDGYIDSYRSFCVSPNLSRAEAGPFIDVFTPGNLERLRTQDQWEGDLSLDMAIMHQRHFSAYLDDAMHEQNL